MYGESAKVSDGTRGTRLALYADDAILLFSAALGQTIFAQHKRLYLFCKKTVTVYMTKYL